MISDFFIGGEWKFL